MEYICIYIYINYIYIYLYVFSCHTLYVLIMYELLSNIAIQLDSKLGKLSSSLPASWALSRALIEGTHGTVPIEGNWFWEQRSCPTKRVAR